MAAHLASRYGIGQQAQELADPDVITLIAEAAGRLAGYAQVRRGLSPPDCVIGEAPVELWRFYVDRPWHGRGLAQRLMAAVHKAARELDGRTLWLSVWERNPRATVFYERSGFHDVGTQDFWLGTDRQTDRIMVARLSPSD
jgi:GNAT superfamily N-acetyltransferase